MVVTFNIFMCCWYGHFFLQKKNVQTSHDKYIQELKQTVDLNMINPLMPKRYFCILYKG